MRGEGEGGWVRGGGGRGVGEGGGGWGREWIFFMSQLFRKFDMY